MKQGKTSGNLDLRNVPSWSEVKKLVFASKSFLKKEYWLYLALVAFTGARRNEIWNLNTDDLVWEDSEVKAVRIKNLQVKKEERKREVPISSLVKNELTDFVKNNRKEEEKLFSFGQRMCNYIFDRAREKVLDKNFCLRDIRHAFGIQMLRKIKDLEKVRRLMGHSNYNYLKTYLNTSKHNLEPELEAAIA